MPASKFWYVRMYIKGRGFVKKSTRCVKYRDAREFAIDWYEERIIEKKSNKVIEKQSFAAYATKLQETQKRLIRRGELVEGMLYNDKLKLENEVLPYMGDKHISKIDYNLVDDFVAKLYDEKEFSQSTLKKYVVLIRKVLKEAERDGIIHYVPTLPTIKRTENPRPWFNPEQYSDLLSACRDLRDNPHDTGLGRTFDFGEMYDFIVFMVHSFLRPSEWKFLQNKHVRMIKENDVEQLVISVPNSKTMKVKGLVGSTTTEIATNIYRKRILKRNPNSNDFLFFNKFENRNTAANAVSRNFKVLVEHAKLEHDQYGQSHTTYSLRHSSLCFQILKTGGNDLFGYLFKPRISNFFVL